jgi:hypothetical protein
LVAVAAFCTACGNSPKAGRTPKETVRSFELALKRLDMGAVYDLLSSRARGEVEEAFGAFRGACARIPEEQLEAAGLDRLRDMSARDLLVEAVSRAKKENPGAVTMLEALHIVVMRVRESGDRASVDVTVLVHGQDRKQTLPMVREGGRWMIDSDDSVTSMPLQLAPDVVQACAAPSG